MMIERRANRRGRKTVEGDVDQAVNEENLLGKYAVLGQIGGSWNQPKTVTGADKPTCDSARERLHDEKRLEAPVSGVGREFLHRGKVIG